MFTIYSIGDSAFLAQILNSLAMICGTGDFRQLVAIGLLLGFFVMGVQCIMSATRQFNLHQVFLGFICYLCFFGPAVTVHIEDAYTGQVRTVDNVPIGAGVAGTLISNIGYGVTQLFEQGYGDVDRMTERSFGDSLKALNDIRAIAYDTSIVDAASQSLGNDTDLRRSLDNYLRECTMVKIVVGLGTPEEVYRGGISALAFNNEIYGTQVFLPGYQGTNMDCGAAWQQLRPQFLQAMNSPQAVAAINRLAGSYEAQGQISTTYDRINNALEAMNTSQVSARDYVSVAVLEPIYKRAAMGFYNDMGDTATALMINQAVEQRNTQWAAEQSLFLSTVRPLMAFFEGFIYAITPFMAFMMVMGAFGMQMITKYFQVVCWIQLWMPVLSIVNLFILMGARNEFASVVTDPMSFYTLNNGSQILQNWIATGGMLAAATPMIALFLVTGSTYAFTSLTNRMAGGDHINEKAASPDTVQPSAILQMMPKATSSHVGATVASGAVVPTFNMGRAVAATATQAKSNLVSLSESTAESMTRTASDQQLMGIAQSAVRTLGSSEAASMIKSVLAGQYEQNDTTKSAAAQETANKTVAGEMGANAAAGVPVTGKIGSDDVDGGKKKAAPTSAVPSVGLNGKASVSTSGSESLSLTQNDGNKTGVHFSDDERATLQKALSLGLQNSNSEELRNFQSDTKAQGFSWNLSKNIQATDNYTKAQSANETLGTNTQGYINQYAHEIMQSPEAMHDLAAMRSSLSPAGRAEINKMAHEFETKSLMSPGIAMTAAMMKHIADHQELGGMPAVGAIYGKARGYAATSLTGPSGNNLEAPAGMKTDPKSLLQPVGFNQNAFNARSKTLRAENASGEAMVREADQTYRGAVQVTDDANQLDARRTQVANAVEGLKNTPLNSFGMTLANIHNVGMDVVKSNFDQRAVAKEFTERTGLPASYGNLYAALSSFSGKSISNAEKEMQSYIKGELSYTLQMPVSDEYARMVTAGIKNHMKSVVANGYEGGASASLNAIKAYHQSVNGQMIAHDIGDPSAKDPQSLGGPERELAGPRARHDPASQSFVETGLKAPASYNNYRPKQKTSQGNESSGPSSYVARKSSTPAVSSEASVPQRPIPGGQSHSLERPAADQPLSEAGAAPGATPFAEQATQQVYGSNGGSLNHHAKEHQEVQVRSTQAGVFDSGLRAVVESSTTADSGRGTAVPPLQQRGDEQGAESQAFHSAALLQGSTVLSGVGSVKTVVIGQGGFSQVEEQRSTDSLSNQNTFRVTSIGTEATVPTLPGGALQDGLSSSQAVSQPRQAGFVPNTHGQRSADPEALPKLKGDGMENDQGSEEQVTPYSDIGKKPSF